MFGAFARSRALAMRDQASKAPQRIVTPAEFRAAAKSAGWDDATIKLQLSIARTLGSSVLVGTEMLTIKDNVEA